MFSKIGLFISATGFGYYSHEMINYYVSDYVDAETVGLCLVFASLFWSFMGEKIVEICGGKKEEE